jgi:hypothetical protein
MTQVVNKKVSMTLVGVDGNSFALMGAFSREARRQGWTSAEIKLVTDRCTQGDYNELISTLMDHIEDNSDEDEDDFFDELSMFEDDEDEDY